MSRRSDRVYDQPPMQHLTVLESGAVEAEHIADMAVLAGALLWVIGVLCGALGMGFWVVYVQGPG